MYVIDDVCYAGEPVKGMRVSKVKPMKGRMMLVTFSTGEKRLFDTTLLQGEAFELLNDEKIFNSPALFHGVITWGDGSVDVAPETVYEMSYPYSY